MKNALKNIAYLKQLNGRRLSLPERVRKARTALIGFSGAITTASKSLQGFMQAAIDNAREQEKKAILDNLK